MKKKIIFSIFCFLAISIFSPESKSLNKTTDISLLVHKTPTCGCCKMWIEHLENNGLRTKTQDHDNLEDIKKKYDIQPQYRSCHTAISSNGYVFEGHIPSKYIDQFLSEDHPNAIGLSVPGMPVGSPGMEVGNRVMPYDVLILYKDGTNGVFARVR